MTAPTTISELGYILRLDADAPTTPPPEPPVLTTAGIQALIDALDSKVGGTVQLEAATYTLTAPVIINKANCSIKGVDEKATRIVFGYDGVAFDVQAVDVEISDLTISGPAHSSAPLSTAIKISSTGAAHISDLNITGGKFAFYNNGISESTTIENVTYSQTGAATCGSFLLSERKDALATDASVHVSACTISDCKDNAITIKHSKPRTHVEECVFSGNASGTSNVKIGSAEGNLLDVLVGGCRFSGTNTAGLSVDVSPSAAQIVGEVSITGCSMKSTDVTQHISALMANIQSKLVISNNTFDGAAGYAIHASGTTAARISGNTTSTGSFGGFDGLNGAGVDVVDNTFFCANDNACISFSNVTNSTLRGNRCTGTTGPGVFIECDPGLGDLSVLGNLIQTDTKTCIQVFGCQRITVANNEMLTNTASGIRLSTAKEALVSGNRVRITSAVGNSVGIRLISQSDDSVVVGNTVKSEADGKHGIEIDSSSQISVTGNVINRPGVNAFALSLVNASKITVTGNVFRTGGANGATVAAGCTAITSFGNNINGGWVGTGTDEINPTTANRLTYDIVA